MAGTEVIEREYIDFDFWTAWPRKFYNVRSYDLTKDDFEKGDLIEMGSDDVEYDDDEMQQINPPVEAILDAAPNPATGNETMKRKVLSFLHS